MEEINKEANNKQDALKVENNAISQEKEDVENKELVNNSIEEVQAAQLIAEKAVQDALANMTIRLND